MATNLQGIGAGVSQTWLSFRFELLKHLKRRRLSILAGLGIVVPLLFLIYYYKGHPVAASDFASASLMLMNVLIVISAAMFAGDAICGEFENKTSLLLFPTPQKRSSIFAGKYLAALMATILVVLLYYLVLTLQTGQLFGWGNVPAELGKSFAAALVYSAAAVSVVFLASSILKRSMSATIVGLLLLLMILPIIAMILMGPLDREPWYIMTYSANLITTVLGGSGGFGFGSHDHGQFTPTFAKGMAVMVGYAIVALAAAMRIAVRKED